MTIRELAAELGVCKSTVAYALNGSPGVSAKTREFILRRAQELGYELNPLTSALLRQIRSRHSPRIHANLAALIDSERTTPYRITRELCRGLCQRARQLGLEVDVINTRHKTSRELMRMLLSRGIEAVAVLPLLRSMGHRRLDWSKFAAVRFGYSMALPRLHQVVPDHFNAIRTAIRMCQRKGFERIGLLLDKDNHQRSNGLWLSGYMGLQQFQSRRAVLRPLMVSASKSSHREIRRWQDRERPQVVILARHDPGKQLPEILMEHPSPAIPVFLDANPQESRHAGIDQRFSNLGMAMASLLARLLVQNERGVPAHPTITHLEGVWVDHPSLRVRGGSGRSREARPSPAKAPV
ncbi:MAG: LacI family DNA-binding transcriptional regulator [Verrucomicrobiota bacterium]